MGESHHRHDAEQNIEGYEVDDAASDPHRVIVHLERVQHQITATNNQARQVKTHQRMQLPVAHSPESLGSARRNRIVVGTVELVDEQCTDEP